jgi:hypothetical protein
MKCPPKYVKAPSAAKLMNERRDGFVIEFILSD